MSAKQCHLLCMYVKYICSKIIETLKRTISNIFTVVFTSNRKRKAMKLGRCPQEVSVMFAMLNLKN